MTTSDATQRVIDDMEIRNLLGRLSYPSQRRPPGSVDHLPRPKTGRSAVRYQVRPCRLSPGR